MPGILGLLRALEQSSSGLDFIRTLLRYLAQVVGTDRLSEAAFRQAVTQALSGGGEQMMTIAEQWVQEGLEKGRQEGRQEGRQKGRQEGLCSERQLLLRLVQKRFGAAMMERSWTLLGAVDDLAVLEELGEGVLDCADGEAWLALLARRAVLREKIG